MYVQYDISSSVDGGGMTLLLYGLYQTLFIFIFTSTNQEENLFMRALSQK